MIVYIISHHLRFFCISKVYGFFNSTFSPKLDLPLRRGSCEVRLGRFDIR